MAICIVVERMPHFLVVLAQASKDQQARLPNLPILTHPSTHGVRKPKILDAEARQRRLEQLFAPNVLSKLRGQALKDVLTRPWKLQNNENLTAIEAMEYFLHLWFKNNIKQPVYIVGGRFQDGLNCKFNILSTENPLENLPRTIVFNEEEEWELSLIGELQYTDYSNAVLDMEQPDEPPFDLNYVKVEIDVCRLLQDDGDNSITIKLPKDKNFKRDKYDSNDNQSEEHESYEDGFDDSGDF